MRGLARRTLSGEGEINSSRRLQRARYRPLKKPVVYWRRMVSERVDGVCEAGRSGDVDLLGSEGVDIHQWDTQAGTSMISCGQDRSGLEPQW